jgi:hypothetical protein
VPQDDEEISLVWDVLDAGTRAWGFRIFGTVTREVSGCAICLVSETSHTNDQSVSSGYIFLVDLELEYTISFWRLETCWNS